MIFLAVGIAGCATAPTESPSGGVVTPTATVVAVAGDAPVTDPNTTAVPETASAAAATPATPSTPIEGGLGAALFPPTADSAPNALPGLAPSAAGGKTLAGLTPDQYPDVFDRI